jgi:rod shape-determining protein MreC
MGSQTGSGLGRRRSTARRVIVSALVVICLATFTLYFREPGDSGPFHSLQSGVSSIVAPVQKGATSAVRPLRDLWGWSTSLVNARDRAATLEKENERLNSLIAGAQIDREELRQQKLISGVGEDYTTDYALVPAQVIGVSPSNWYARAQLYVGSDRGVVKNSPVLAGAEGRPALVGKITSVSANASEVTWITDSQSAVGIAIPDASPAKGILQASSIPGQLIATDIPREAGVKKGAVVETGGFAASRALSVFPAGLPVGLVSSTGPSDQGTERTIQVSPFVDPRGVKYVVVLAPKSELAKRRASGG